MNPFGVVKAFEAALCEYTGAPFAVTTTSCTMALLLAVAWHLADHRHWSQSGFMGLRPGISIPRRTYIGVPMSIIHAGGRPVFRDESWLGSYQLKPLPVWDSARWFTRGMYRGRAGWIGNVPVDYDVRGQMVCVSFHWNKTLGIQQGGAILHDDPKADRWLRKARFDGREEGVPPSKQHFDVVGWHAYMAPETAAAGLVRLAHLPDFNEPLPNDDYPDLSEMEIFR